ncbi:MAG: adenylosuccinate synthase [Candidatus ainarchaeum sp.]|nr:adenylosuccinate synthase [Candidatus ainarchaeum sp.]
MAVAAVIGAQWGDEGKGKIVDFLAGKADVVVRFNGGDNAGHTVMFGGKKFKMHALPSGCFHEKKQVVVGAGCAVNPKTLLEELGMLAKAGIRPNLLIDARAHVVLPYHLALDGAQEALKGSGAVGTTRRGIGPCYADKAARIGLRFADLLDKGRLEAKVRALHEIKAKELGKVYGAEFAQSEAQVFSELSGQADRLAGFVCDAILSVNESISKGKNVLLEGAQGSLLGIDSGFYPYCTSSNPTSGGASTGAGIAPSKITEVVGVLKAYVSRVGEGPLPTELPDGVGEAIRDKGNEFGTTTGRPRRIGWLDLPCLRQASEINGFTSLAFTRLDTLGGIPGLRICSAYKLGGKTLHRPPASSEALSDCKPVCEEIAGWEDLSPGEWRAVAGKGVGALPAQARAYVERVSSDLGVPASIVSVGPGREDTIIIKDVFAQ